MSGTPQPPFSIRPSRHDDHDALGEIYRLGQIEILGEGVGSVGFEESVKGETVWVAARDGCPLGFISLWAADEFIHNLFVHPRERGKGVGSALLRKVLETSDRPVTLKCLVANSQAVRFYLARGWRIEATDTGSQGDCYVMRFP